MPLHSKQSLREKLRSRKFRESFVSSRIAQSIAMQARVLRQRQEMSQADLARLLGTSQNAIYRLENPKYGRPNISTLEKVASFFDVGLIVRFASFSEIAEWTLNLSGKSLEIPDFEHDTGFMEPEQEPEQAATIAPTLGPIPIYADRQGLGQGLTHGHKDDGISRAHRKEKPTSMKQLIREIQAGNAQELAS
jgi:transcriptional regulator with XRE-family HTH domain